MKLRDTVPTVTWYIRTAHQPRVVGWPDQRLGRTTDHWWVEAYLVVVVFCTEIKVDLHRCYLGFFTLKVSPEILDCLIDGGALLIDIGPGLLPEYSRVLCRPLWRRCR